MNLQESEIHVDELYLDIILAQSSSSKAIIQTSMVATVHDEDRKGECHPELIELKGSSCIEDSYKDNVGTVVLVWVNYVM